MRSNHPSRRSHTSHNRQDDLILWLKFENDFVDSSNFNQKTTTYHSMPLPEFYDGQSYLGASSAAFLTDKALAVSGQGYDVPNANLFEFGERDFTIEFATKFFSITDSEQAIFDWGNLKLTNWKGVFSIHTPHTVNTVIDYYDGELNLEGQFNHLALVRKRGEMSLFVNGISVTEDYIPNQITGLADQARVKTIGCNINQDEVFNGLIDNFKVYNSAIYGTEPIYTSSDIYTEGVLSNSLDHSPSSNVKKGQKTSLTIDVMTSIPPRDQSETPYEYNVHWFKDGRNIFDGRAGPMVEAIEGRYVKNEYDNELEIKNFSENDEGMYSAKINFPKLATIEYPFLNPTELKFIDFENTEDPIEVEWCEATHHSVMIQNGDDAELFISTKNGMPPFDYIWKRNGRKINEGPNVEFPEGGLCEASIRFKNVTHNITNITCEVVDCFKRSSETISKGNVFMISQKAVPPLVLDVYPKENSGSLIVTKTLKEVSENNHAAYYEFVGNQESINIKINAYNVNHTLANSGNIVFEWWIGGAWKISTEEVPFLLQGGQKTIIKCRLGLSNKPNVYSYINIYVNYEGKCHMPLALFKEEYPEKETEKEMVAQTGEVVSFSYLYICCEDTEGYELIPDELSTTDDIDIEAGTVSTILDLSYEYSENYRHAVDSFSFSKQLWLDDNDNNGEQSVSVLFSNACGEKKLIKKIRVEKATCINGQIENTNDPSPVAFYNRPGETHSSDGWISPSSRINNRIYYRVLINDVDMSGYRKVPERGEVLSGAEEVYKDSCLGLVFDMGSDGLQPVSLKFNGDSSCWSNGDTVSLEFYNNLPSENGFSQADKFVKDYSVIVSSSLPFITSPYNNSIQWTMSSLSSQTSGGKTINTVWAYDNTNQAWYQYQESNAIPRYSTSFNQVPVSRCWVAREVYGEKVIRWILFRDWISKKENKLLCFLYDLCGKKIASFIKNKPKLKSIIKGWMDKKIDG